MTTRRPFLRRLLASPLLTALLLAGCGGAAPAGSPSPSVDSGSLGPSPVESAPAPASVPVPSPSAATAPGGPYAEALVAKLGSEDLTTHVVQVAEVTTTANGTQLTVGADMDGDIAGQDMALSFQIRTAGQELSQQMVLVGETAYVTQADGSWGTAPRAVVADAFAGLIDNLRVVEDPADLRYVGIETVDGRELHRLTAARPVAYSPATGGTGQYETLDIWVEDDGTPVRIDGTFTATDANGNQGRGTSEMTFSNFGGAIEIVAPSLEPSPS